jgi:hypothetical protein
VTLKVDLNRQAFPRIRSAADAFLITAADLRGPVLTRLAQEHRRQEKQIFSSEGAAGGSGPWPELSPKYLERKRRALSHERRRRREAKKKGKKVPKRKPTPAGAGRGAPLSLKILIWSGDMRERFVSPSRPENIERFILVGPAKAPTGGVFQFGAQSDIAAYHFAGGDVLPQRDMVSKSPEQIGKLQAALVKWYNTERLPQVTTFIAQQARLANAGRPKS